MDFYRLDITKPNFIIIELSNIPENLDYQLSLQNQEGLEVKKGDRTGNTRLIGYRATSERVLYIIVKSQNGFDQYNAYRLQVKNAESTSNLLVIDQIKVYPNPCYGFDPVIFNYVIPSRNLQFAERVDLEIYTIDHNLVYTDVQLDVIGSNQFSVNTNQLTSGIYVYMIQAQKREELVRKFGKFAVAR